MSLKDQSNKHQLLNILCMRLIVISLIVLLLNTAHAAVKHMTLSNGLKICVKSNHRTPATVVMIWYDVGAADEPGGLTGISHVLEHNLFKGTQRYPGDDYSKRITALGGTFNAATSYDYTMYYALIAATHLKNVLLREADRMQNITWNQSIFSREMQVIREERRLRTDDQPQSLALERFLATAHLSSPYHHPVIGWMSDLNHMTMQDAEQWYRRFYAPNHATLVVVGDVDEADVLREATLVFGDLKPNQPWVRPIQVEPDALGEKTVQIKTHALLPTVIIGYTVPSLKTAVRIADPYTLEVIAALLGAPGNGRFSTILERDRAIASEMNVHYDLYTRFESQFSLYGTPAKGHSLNELSEGVFDIINQLQHTRVSNEALSRVKTQLIAQKTFERDSLLVEAQEIGLLETLGLGAETADQYTSRITQVSAEDIQRVANRYFQPKNRTVARLNS